MSTPERPEAADSLTGTVVRGAGFSGLGFILARGLNLAAYIVLARLVTPDELGDFAAGSILVGIGLLLSQSGMLAAVIHRRDRLEEAAATAVVATVGAGLAMAVIGWAASPLIGRFFDSATVAAVAAAMAGVLFLQSARVVPNALLQRRFSMLRRIVVEPIAAVAFAVGAIVATANGLGVWGLVAGAYAQALVDVVLSWVMVRWRPKLRLASFAMWRELVSYGRHVLAGTLLRRIADQVPVALIGRYVGTAPLGQYQYANRIVATPFAMLLAGVSYVVFPAFARIADQRARFDPAFLRSVRWMMFVATPLGLILIPLGEPLAVLVFGDRWAEAGEAAMALSLFIPGRALAAVAGEGFKGAGVPGERTRVNVVGVLAGATAMVALLPPFGLLGVAAGVSVDAVVSGAYSVLRARTAMGVPAAAMLAAAWPPLAAAVPMVAALLPLEMLLVDAASRGTAVGLILLTAEAVLGILIYGVALRWAAPGFASESKRLLRAGRRRTASPGG